MIPGRPLGRRELRKRFGHLLAPDDSLLGAQTTVWVLDKPGAIRAAKGPGARGWTLTWERGGPGPRGTPVTGAPFLGSAKAVREWIVATYKPTKP